MPYKGDKGDKNAARPPEGSLVETRCLIKGPKSAIVPFPGPRSGPKSRTGPGASQKAKSRVMPKPSRSNRTTTILISPYQWVQTFPKLIRPKVKGTVRLEFELANFQVATQHSSHYATGTPRMFSKHMNILNTGFDWSIQTYQQPYLNHRWDLNRYYHSGSEWNWEYWQ